MFVMKELTNNVCKDLVIIVVSLSYTRLTKKFRTATGEDRI